MRKPLGETWLASLWFPSENSTAGSALLLLETLARRSMFFSQVGLPAERLARKILNPGWRRRFLQ